MLGNGTVGNPPDNITIGQLTASVASLPNSTNVTVEVTITQNWQVEFDGTDTGGDTAFHRLLATCQEKYPSCTGTIVSSPSRLRRALGTAAPSCDSQTATFIRVGDFNNSEPVTAPPQLEADNVTVCDSTVTTITAQLLATALGGQDEASALTDGSLSPDAATSAVSDDLGLPRQPRHLHETHCIVAPLQ